MGLDLLLRADHRGDKLQLVDLNNASKVIHERELSSTLPFVIPGSAAGDRLRIDFLKPFKYRGEIFFDAGGGQDDVQLNTRHLDELSFSSAHTPGASFSTQFGVNRFTVSGLESLVQHGTVNTVSFTGSDESDTWTLLQHNDQLQLKGFGQPNSRISFTAPSERLSLNGRGGDDVISIVDVHLNSVDLAIQGGAGADTIELTRVQGTRSDSIIDGGTESDTLLIDRSRLSRSNVSLIGGADADTLTVTANKLERSDLLVEGGEGHDDLTLDFNLLSRSDLVIRGGNANIATSDAADRDDDDTIKVERLQLERSSANIEGGSGDDRIAVGQVVGSGLRLDGGHGTDTLQGPRTGASWSVTGLNSGTLNGYPFALVENLVGSDEAVDRFVVEEPGDLDGLISGGERGGDELLLRYSGNSIDHHLGGYGTQRITFGSKGHDHLGIESITYVTPNASTQTVTVKDEAHVRLTQNEQGQLVVTHAFAYDSVVSAEDEALVVDGGADSMLAYSVANAGDVNADGIDDLLIGAPGADVTYLLFGNAGGLAGIDLTTLDGTNGVLLAGAKGSRAGTSVAGARDVNADGIDDVIVGAPGLAGGYAAVVFGRSGSFAATIDLESLNGTNGFRILGSAAGDGLGTSVASLFDFNADHIADVVIGAPGSDTSGPDGGSAYVVFGGEGPFAPTIDVGSLDGTNGFAMHGIAAGESLGTSVAGGDIDADGLADAVIGAPGANNGAGAVYAVVGRITDLPAAIDLTALQGQNGFVVNGDQPSDNLGSSLAIGDVDSDGIDDILIAAPGAALAYAIFGTQADHAAVYSVTSLDGNSGLIIDATSLDNTTGMAVASIGDMNGDTLSDFALSAPHDTGGAGSGSVFVFYGDENNRSGVTTPTTLSVADLDGTNGFRVDGSSSDEGLGAAMAGADPNADGFSDLIIGAPTAAVSAGRLLILDGRDEGGAELSTTFDLPTESFSIIAESEPSGARIYIGLEPINGDETGIPSRIDMAGADLTVDLSSGAPVGNPRRSRVTVEPNTTIATGSESGDSGHIHLGASNVIVGWGAQLRADGMGGADGDVKLLASQLISDSPLLTDDLLEIYEAFEGRNRQVASVEVDGATTIVGGNVTIEAEAGEQNLLEYVAQALGGLAESVSSAILGYASDIFSFPVSVILRASTAKVLIGNGVDDVTIDGSKGVKIAAKSTAESQAKAVNWGYFDISFLEFAVGVSEVKATAEVQIHDGVTIHSGGSVDVSSKTTTTNTATARVSANIGKSPLAPTAEEFPDDPDAKVAAFMYATSEPTAHVTLDSGAVIDADGAVKIDATGVDTSHTSATGTTYSDGRGGLTFNYSESNADIQTLINGTVISRLAPGAEKSTTFNPFTDVDYKNSALVLGKDHGFKTSDPVYYDPGDGAGPVTPLQPGTTYFAVEPDGMDDRIQLALTPEDAEAGSFIELDQQPILTSGDGKWLALGQINSVDELIQWSFEHGIADGTALVYTAAANKAVPGLVDGQTYYAIVGDDPTSMGLAATVGGEPIDLEIAPWFTVEATGKNLTVESVDSVNSIITFTEDHGLAAGDAIEYHGSLGITLFDDDTGEPIADGVYYAVAVYDESGELSTNEIRLATTQEDALDGNSYNGLIDFTAGSDSPTGSSHSLVDESSVGIKVDATLTNDHKFLAQSRVGKKLGPLEPLTKGELAGNLTTLPATIVAGAQAAATAAWDFLTGKTSDKTQEAQESKAPANANVNTGKATIDLAASGTVYRIDSTVQAVVGSHGKLASFGDIAVDAVVTEKMTATSEGLLTQGKQNGVAFAMGGAVSVGGADHTARAIINDGAQVDAGGTLRVDAEVNYPFRIPIQNPEKFGDFVYTSLKDDQTGLMRDLTDEVMVLQDAVFNHWTRAVSRLNNADTSAAVTVDYNYRDGGAEAIIAEGAQINQDPTYWNAAQSVSVKARTQLDLVAAGGIFNAMLNPVGVANAVEKLLVTEIYAPMGSTSKEGGLGTSVVWQRQDLHTTAGVGLLSPVDDTGKKIDDPISSGHATRVRTGDGGKLDVYADEDIFALQILQTGASVSGQNAYVFDGGAAIVDYDSDTTAAIAGGTVVTGGSVDVRAVSEFNGVALNGDIAEGGALGAGAAVTIWSVERNTKSYIGANNTDGPTDDVRAPVDFTGLASGADLTVHAEDTGGVYLFSLAAEVSSAAPREQPQDESYNDQSQQPIELRNSRSNSINDDQSAQLGGGGASKSPSFGLSVSADVAILELRDRVYAFIDDSGQFNADAVSVTALNDTNSWAVSGALAIALNDQAKSSNAMAGSYAEMSLFDNVTSAFINDATITAAAGLVLDAKRLGNTTAASAGGTFDSRNNLGAATGLSLAGSAAVVHVDQKTTAKVDGATLKLGADSSIASKDNLSIQTIAGGLDIGGKLGAGGSVAYTKVDAHSTATIVDSSISQVSGGLAIDATMGSTDKSRVIAAAATTGFSPDAVVLGATVVLTEVNVDGDDPAVTASMTGSTYTNTYSHAATGDGALTIHAADETSYAAGAGAVTIDGKSALDYAYAENRVHQKVRATIDDSAVTSQAPGALDMDAVSKVGAQAYALGAVGDGTALDIAGSTSVNRIKRDVQATVEGRSQIDVQGDFAAGASIATTGSPNAGIVIGVAGAFGDVTGKSAGAAGAAVVDNDVSDTVMATIDDSTVEAGGAASLTSTNGSGQIVGGAVGLDRAEQFAAGGSVVTNTVDSATTAGVTSGATLSAAGDINIEASELDVDIVASAGQVVSASKTASAGQGVAVGAAIATNTGTSTVTAQVVDSDVASTAGAASIKADRRNPLITSLTVGGDLAGSFAAGGAAATNDLTHNTIAEVTGNSTFHAVDDVTIAATESGVAVAAGAGTIDAGKVSIGASIATNKLRNDVRASLGGRTTSDTSSDNSSAVSSQGSVSIEADKSDSTHVAIAVGGEGGQTAAVGGSVATNDVTRTVDAHVVSASASGTVGIDLLADFKNSTTIVLAGNVDLGFASQLAKVNAPSEIQVKPEIVDPVNAANEEPVVLSSPSRVEEAFNGLDVSESLSNGNEMPMDSEASIDNVNSGNEPLTLPAADLPPAASGSPIAVGAALAFNFTDNTVLAVASDASLTSSAGDVIIDAALAEMNTAAAGAGIAASNSTLSGAAAASTNEVTHTVKAYIDGSSDGSSQVTANGSVSVAADSVAHFYTIAGNASFTTDTASLGISTAILDHNDHTESYIDNAAVSANGRGAGVSVKTGSGDDKTQVDDFTGVSVAATSREVVTTIAAGVSDDGTGGTGGANLGASVSVITLDETTNATIKGGATVSAADSGVDTGHVNVFASSDTQTLGAGGAIGVSGSDTFGLGVSVDAGDITKTTIAKIASTDVEANGNVSVQALSSEKITSYQGTLEASKGTVIAGTSGVYVLDLTTQAIIDGDSDDKRANVSAAGSVLVSAHDKTRLDQFAGSVEASAGGKLGVGATLGYSHVRKQTEAYIGANTASVDAESQGQFDPITVLADGFDISYTGDNGDGTEVQSPDLTTADNIGLGSEPIDDSTLKQNRVATAKEVKIHGVAVSATNSDIVKSQAYSAGLSDGIVFDGSGLARTGTNIARAHIDGGEINAKPPGANNQTQGDVLVTASHDYHRLGIVGALAVSGQGAATPAMDWASITLDTEATIGDATVASGRDTRVTATGSEHFTNVAVGLAASANLGFDGSANVTDMNSTVLARIGENAKVDAHGNVQVAAQDDTKATSIAGGLAVEVGVGAAIDAAFSYVNLVKDTAAVIDNGATVDGRGNTGATMIALDGSAPETGALTTQSVSGVAVTALSSETLQSDAISGALSTNFGVTGAVLFTHVNSDTTARIGDNASINRSGGAAAADQAVTVTAGNDVKATNIAGGVSGGLGVLGGAVDVGIVRNDTVATIGNNATVGAAGDVAVHAVTRKDVTSHAISSADGYGGIAGSVSVWTLGRQLDSTYDTVSTTDNDALAQQAGRNGEQPKYAGYSDHADTLANRSDVAEALGSYESDSGAGGEINGRPVTTGAQRVSNVGLSAKSNMQAANEALAGTAGEAMAATDDSNTTAQVLATTAAGAGIFAGGDIDVTTSDRIILNTQTGSVSVDFYGIGAAVSVATLRGGGDAHVDGHLSAGGSVTISSTGEHDLKSGSLAGQAGVVGASAAVAVIEDHSKQEAYLASGAVVNNSKALDIFASQNYVRFEVESGDGGFVGIVAGASVAQAKSMSDVQAHADNVMLGSASQPLAGDISIAATFTPESHPKATATAISVGIGAGDGTHADATFAPGVMAWFGDGGTAGIWGDGNVDISATSVAQPYAEALGVAAGALAVGVSLATATASQDVIAFVADHATISLPGAQSNLSITAQSGDDAMADDPFAHARASGGGVVSIDAADAQVFIEPTVSAYIGAQGTVNVGESVLVTAEELWAGFAHGSGGDYGALAIGENSGTLTIKPQVTAYISAANVNAQGVSVKAESGEAGSLPQMSFDTSNVDYANNTIAFNEPHGLKDEDQITYHDNGAPIGGLEDGRTYTVNVIDDLTVKLVGVINSGNVNPLTHQVVGTGQPHGLTTGTPVVYDTQGSEAIGGLVNGQTYFVNAADPTTLRFADSLRIAENLHQATFKASGASESGDYIQLNTVVAAGPQWIGDADSGNEYLSFSEIPTDWKNGDRVAYVVTDNQVIDGLVAGNEYYVRQSSDHEHRWHFYPTQSDYENDTNKIKFHSDNTGRFFKRSTSDWMVTSDGGRSPDMVFSPKIIDFVNDAIVFSDLGLYPPIVTGDVVSIAQLTAASPNLFGVPDGLFYYAHVTDTIDQNTGVRTFSVKLAFSKSDLDAGAYVDLLGSNSDPQNFALTLPFKVATGDALTYNKPLDLQFTASDITPTGTIIVDTSDAEELGLNLVELVRAQGKLTFDIVSTYRDTQPLSQLTPGTAYDFEIMQWFPNSVEVMLFDSSGLAIPLVSDEDTAGGAPTQYVLRLGFEPLDGLVDGNVYYVIVDNANPGRVKLATSHSNAMNGTHVDLFPAPTVTVGSSTLTITGVDYGTNRVTVAGGAITTGQALTYHAADNKWIVGITGGETYYAIEYGNGVIGFADSVDNAKSGVARDLLPYARINKGSAAHSVTVNVDEDTFTLVDPSQTLETGDAVTYQGIFGQYLLGVDKGPTYYAVRVNPDDPTVFRLADSYLGAITSDGRSNTIRFHQGVGGYSSTNNGTQFLGNNGIAITAPSVASDQRLTVDLSDAGAFGTQSFSVPSAQPTSGSPASPTVQVSASNGDLFGAMGASAAADIKPVVTAFIGSADGADVPSNTVITATDVFLKSTSNVDVKSHAFDYDVNVLVGLGTAQSEVSIFNTADAYVGAGVSITAGRTLAIDAESNETVDAQTSIKGGAGLIDDVYSHSDVNIGRSTTVTIGDSARVTNASGDLTITATSVTDGNSTAKAHANGGVTLPTPKSLVNIGTDLSGDAQTAVFLGDKSTLTSNNGAVNIAASSTYKQFASYTTDHSHSVYSNDNAVAELIIDEDVRLQVGNNVSASSAKPGSIHVSLDWSRLSAIAEVYTRALVDDSHAQAELLIEGGATVNGALNQTASEIKQVVSSAHNTDSDNFKELHKVVSTWFWLGPKVKKGGDPTDNTVPESSSQAEETHEQSTIAPLSAVKSALLLPEELHDAAKTKIPTWTYRAHHGRTNVAPDRIPRIAASLDGVSRRTYTDLAFSQFDRAGTDDAASASDEIPDAAIDAAMSDPSPLL